jgi:hypothetical protein
MFMLTIGYFPIGKQATIDEILVETVLNVRHNIMAKNTPN